VPNRSGIIFKNLTEKYSSGMETYNIKIINDIIGNEPTRIVSVFKDYLLQDDMNDFLRKSYSAYETRKKLPQVTSYYSKYCTVFPNYINLEEKQYIYK
jgi:hypothetical protein